jgi:hypothetical protein
MLAKENNLVGLLAKLMKVNGQLTRDEGHTNIFQTLAVRAQAFGKYPTAQTMRKAVDRFESRLAEFNVTLYRVRRGESSHVIDILTLKHDHRVWVEGGRIWFAWESHWWHRFTDIQRRQRSNLSTFSRTARAVPELNQYLVGLQTSSLDGLLPKPATQRYAA